MKRRSPQQPRRRGATLVFMAIVMVFVAGMIAFAVDVGRMTVVRNEIQSAVDAGALAANLRLRQDYQAVGEAALEARAFIQKNHVGSFAQIPDGAIGVEIGRWNPATKSFQATNIEPDSVRVFATQDSEPFFFGRLLGRSTFSAGAEAIATGSARPADIMLVLDLSASMDDYGRIEALWNSVPTFVDVIETLGTNDQIGVMGLAADPDDYDPVAEGHNGVEYNSGLHATAGHYVGILEADLTFDFDDLRDNVLSASNLPASKYTGWTGTGAALGDAAHYIAYGGYARYNTGKYIVLMSDGYANRPEGSGPEYARQMAAYAAGMNIKIYTISLGDDADTDLMIDIANAGEGSHFDARGSGETQLTEALTEAFKGAASAIKRSRLVK